MSVPNTMLRASRPHFPDITVLMVNAIRLYNGLGDMEICSPSWPGPHSTSWPSGIYSRVSASPGGSAVRVGSPAIVRV